MLPFIPGPMYFVTFFMHFTDILDIRNFLANLKMLVRRAEQNKWSPTVFHDKLNQLLTNSDVVFKCPSMDDLWRFHKEMASRFQEK
jgi:hypothetical protein